MSKYVIIADSTCDLPIEYAKQNNLEVINLKYTINDKTYENTLDGKDQPFEEFYQMIRDGGMGTTSQLNSEDIKKVYIPYLEQGYDIIYISLSSGLSGSFNSSRLATLELSEEYKDRTIKVVDSLCASMGIGLLVHYAIEYKKQGKSIEENYNLIEELKLKINHWFTVSDIDLLRRGGRVSGAQAFIAKTIKIKPVLHVDNEGHLIPKFKKIGRKLALKELLNQFDKNVKRDMKQTVFISHGDSLEDALYVKQIIEEEYDFVENVMVNFIGPVIGSHSGPGTIALFYIGDSR